jgi:hypothetical protein
MSSITFVNSNQLKQGNRSVLPKAKQILYKSIKKSIELLEDSVVMIMIVMIMIVMIMIVMAHTSQSPELGLIEHFCDRSGQPEQQR